MKKNVDTIKIYVWADGTWCYEEELKDFEHKSDDISEVTLQAEDINSDDDIENYIHRFLNT